MVDLNIGGYPFRCVPLSGADFYDIAAVYVIICVNPNSTYNVIDIGQTGQLGTRIDSHDRQECWNNKCPTLNIWVCVYPMPTREFSEKKRTEVEQELRTRFGPPCGQR